MKRIFAYAIAAAALMAGCQKVNNVSRPDNGTTGGNGDRVEIKFRSNMLTVDTKASLDGLNASHDLYVYGLNRTKPGVGEIINAKAHMARPVGAADDWSLSSGSLEFADDKTFFYNATKDRYDFYAYYVADAAEIPEKLDNYQIGITIDGTQDILLAAADPEKDIQAPGVDIYQVTGTENVYSAWAARRGVTPDLEFRHALAQYRFEVLNHGTKPVVLQAIQVTSKTQGVLTVINQDPSSEGAADGLVQGLAIKSDDVETVLTLKSNTFTVGGALLDPGDPETEDDDVMTDGLRLEGSQSVEVPLQGEIMTFAGQENNVILRLVQEGMKPGQYRQITMPIELDETENYGTVSQAGYSYLISLVIYSLESAELNVSLVGWNDGGNIFLDQEEKVDDPDSVYEDEIYEETTDETI